MRWAVLAVSAFVLVAGAAALGVATAARAPSQANGSQEEAACSSRPEPSQARCAQTAMKLREAARQLSLTRCVFARGGRRPKGYQVLFAARSHIYMHPDWTMEHRRKHFGLYSTKIEQIFDGVNAIFREQKLNIVIVNILTGGVVNAGMVVAELNLFGPIGDDLTFVVRRGQVEADRIQVHWSERSSSVVLAYGGKPAVRPYYKSNWAGMADNNFGSKSVRLLAQTMAHELGHYFLLEHVAQDGNLMFEGAREDRTALTDDQRQTVWRAVTRERKHLDALSCFTR